MMIRLLKNFPYNSSSKSAVITLKLLIINIMSAADFKTTPYA